MVKSELLSFTYDHRSYRQYLSVWLEIVDRWVEQKELIPLFEHFQDRYHLSPENIKQFLKRTIANWYDFTSCSFLRCLSFKNDCYSKAWFFSTLGYLLIHSRKNGYRRKKTFLIIDDIYDMEWELKPFSHFRHLAPFEIVYVATRKQAAGLVEEENFFLFANRQGYEKSVLNDVIRVEYKHGCPLYRSLSQKLGVDIYRLAFSVLNQYLYYHRMFSSISAEYCLTWRDYSAFSIKRAMFKQFGGKAVCTVQRSRHGLTTLAAFMDVDIYFPLGDWFTELARRLGGKISKVIPVGSLFCEVNLADMIPVLEEFDIVFIDTLMGEVLNFYDGYYEDHMEVYTWLGKFASSHRDVKVAFKCDQRYPLRMQVMEELKRRGVHIFNTRDSYKEALKGRIVATYHSTMGFELMGAGYPILFCDPGQRSPYMPDDETFKPFCATDYDSFCGKVEELLSMSQKEKESYAHSFAYFAHSSLFAAKTMIDVLRGESEVQLTIIPSNALGVGR